MTGAGAEKPIRLAVVAGEESGDLLAGDLVSALRHHTGRNLELAGVGGPALEAEGLKPLFDFHELSIIGFGAVVGRLPSLVYRIRQTVRAITAFRPDCVLIVDSPDFSHRVARGVRSRMPSIPIVDYVSPTVWAWRPARAAAMATYIDHVLAVLPFEPAIMAELGGPPTTYVGHRLTGETTLLAARAVQMARHEQTPEHPVCLVLPGSRSGELKRLLPVMGEAVSVLSRRRPQTQFILPAVRRHADTIRSDVESWPVKPDIVVGEEEKWRAFARADAAMAASGTVLLELALANVPAVSVYVLDPISRQLSGLVTAWTAALPNLIADYPFLTELFNERVRPGAIARWMERLMMPTPERQAVLAGYDEVWRRMAVDWRPGEKAAEIVAGMIEARNRK